MCETSCWHLMVWLVWHLAGEYRRMIYVTRWHSCLHLITPPPLAYLSIWILDLHMHPQAGRGCEEGICQLVPQLSPVLSCQTGRATHTLLNSSSMTTLHQYTAGYNFNIVNGGIQHNATVPEHFQRNIKIVTLFIASVTFSNVKVYFLARVWITINTSGFSSSRCPFLIYQ